MTPAAVKVRPGLLCKLYPKGGKPAEGLPIYTDDDGYARFHALRMQEASRNRYQILDCTDDQGKHSVVPVDFASKDIFARHLLDIDGERGKARPALTGDPFSYSEIELMKAGYGLRPDPAFDPAAYLSWLMSASTPGRMLESKRTNHRKHDRFVQQAPSWTGSVLTGAPNYLSVAGMFNVPTAVAGGDQTTYTGTSVWNGLGGFFGSSGLIQSGIDLFTTPTSAGYISFREYCCGDPNSNGYGGDFAPNPGDVIYVQNWYCDAQGRINLNGGYGCSFLHDLNTSAILNCSLANGSPCWSVPALPLCSVNPNAANCMIPGVSAEFIAENVSPQVTPPTTAFTDFTPTLRMTGSARSSGIFLLDKANPYSQNIGSDPTVFQLTDFTNTTTRMRVTLGSRDATCFTIRPRSGGRFPVFINCPSTPLPSGLPIGGLRRDEIVAVILYGIIQDGGGVYLLGKTPHKVPPRGPLQETLAALPADLRERLSPMLRDLPRDSEAGNLLAARLGRVVSNYRTEKLLKGQQP